MLQTTTFSTVSIRHNLILRLHMGDKYIISPRIALPFYKLMQFNSGIVTLTGQSCLSFATQQCPQRLNFLQHN